MSLAQRVVQEKRRLIYPLIVGLVANAALYAVVIYPLSMKVAAGEASAQNASAASANARRDFESARATVTGKAAADAELTKFYGTVLPPDQSTARRISGLEIDRLATKFKVTNVRGTSDVTQERGSRLGKLTATVTLAGEYREIRQFIYALETAPHFLILENVAVTQDTDVESSLNVTVKVATYFQVGENGV